MLISKLNFFFWNILDGNINFQEFIEERAKDPTKEWLLTEKERFDSELDKNKEGFLNEVEIIALAIPDNNEITTEEVNHLFAGPGISTFPHKKWTTFRSYGISKWPRLDSRQMWNKDFSPSWGY